MCVCFSAHQFIRRLREGGAVPVFLLGDAGDRVHRGHGAYQPLLSGLPRRLLLLLLVWSGAAAATATEPAPAVSVGHRVC